MHPTPRCRLCGGGRWQLGDVEKAMERTLVSVTPAAHGWRVQCGEDVYEDLHGMHHALWTAWNLARDVHRTTGLPTAVTVRMGCGDGVMMGYNG